jgi:hypothetical protein
MPYFRVLVSITPSITGEKDTYDMLSLFVDAHDVTNVEAAVQKCIDNNYGYCEDAPITIAPARFDDMEQKPMANTPVDSSPAGTCWVLDYKTGCGWDWSMVNWAASCPTLIPSGCSPWLQAKLRTSNLRATLAAAGRSKVNETLFQAVPALHLRVY